MRDSRLNPGRFECERAGKGWLFGRAEEEDVLAAEVAGLEDFVGQVADRALASGEVADETAGGDVFANLGGRGGGAGAEAGDLHGEQVIDVVPEVTDVF